MPKDKNQNSLVAKNQLYDINTGEISLVDSPMVPDGVYALLKGMEGVKPDGDLMHKFALIKSTNKVKKQIFGYALVPDKPDHEGDVVSAEEVEKAANVYMKNLAFRIHKGTGAGVQHSTFNGDVYPIQSAIDVDGSIGKMLNFPEDQIIKGGWIIGMQVLNDKTWEQIEKGELTGYSIGGWGKRKPIQENVATSSLGKARETINDMFSFLFKGDGDAKSFLAFYNSKKLNEDFWKIFYSLEDSIKSILGDSTVTDKQAAINVQIGQFAAVMANYVAAYAAGQVTESEGQLVAATKTLNELTDKFNKITNNDPSKGDEDVDAKILKELTDKITTLTDKVGELEKKHTTEPVKKEEGPNGTTAVAGAPNAAGTEAEQLAQLTKNIDGLTTRIEKIEKTPLVRNGSDVQTGEPGTAELKKGNKFAGSALSFTGKQG